MSDSTLFDKLQDILETIQTVQNRTADIETPHDFVKDEDAVWRFDGVLMRLQTIGETLKSVEKSDGDFFAEHADFDIEGAIKLGDIISHHYADINPAIVFDICKNHLSPLKNKIQTMLNEAAK